MRALSALKNKVNRQFIFHLVLILDVAVFLLYNKNLKYTFVSVLQMSAGSYCYLVFCVVCLIVAVYVYFVIPETKNKTFVEISQMFATKDAIEESLALDHPDQLKLRKMNGYGYGSLENGSLEFDSSSSCP